MQPTLYQPRLQFVEGAVSFFRKHRGEIFASSALMGPISKGFVAGIYRYAEDNGVPVVAFAKGQRKDDVAHEHLARSEGTEGVLFIGRAQEKTKAFHTEKRHNPVTGVAYPWIVQTAKMVNQFYIYAFDDDFGPFFLKFSSYFPYNAKLCINGNEWAKRQATKAGTGFDALDNGFAACDDPERLQRICDKLGPAQVDRMLRKWLARLPHPFTLADRRAGYLYDISVLQAEFSLTQVLDRPASGRAFFETVIAENLDIGRPDRVSVIFDRKVRTRGHNPTPSRYRTRVITQGVTPSLHVEYKHTTIKQYHKENKALRTETTINDTRDFGTGKRLCNLPALRKVGFSANRRLLYAQAISHDPVIGDTVFNELDQPVVTGGRRVAGLRFGDPRAQALLAAVVICHLLPGGFNNRQLREHVAQLLGTSPDSIKPGRMTYDLRRLRAHGLIERVPCTHSYRPTPLGWRTAWFYVHAYNRFVRTGTAHVADPASTAALGRALDDLAATSGIAA